SCAAPRRRAAKRIEQLAHGRVAIPGFERETATHDLVQPLRDTASPPIEDRSAPNLGGEVVCGLRGEWPMAMKRLPQRNAERELIGAVIDAVAPQRLDRQISRRPSNGVIARRRPAGQSEVADLDAAIATEQDVLRLEIAVDDARGVRGGESLASEQEHRDDVAPAARTLGDPRTQRGALDQLHRGEHAIAKRPDLVDRDDTRVADPRHRLRFGEDLRACAVHGPGLLMQELERDVAIQLGIVGHVHGPHPAATNQLERDESPDHHAELERWAVVRALCWMRGVALGGSRCSLERGCQVDDDPAAARAGIDVRFDLRTLFARQTMLQQTDEGRLGQAGRAGFHTAVRGGIYHVACKQCRQAIARTVYAALTCSTRMARSAAPAIVALRLAQTRGRR
ncbi:MAG TPA: hypothetical protein VFD36_31065, partial [Kofleriaceae bacterium]|nr:hypothetical protein [Kofleriaceae bacterium]